MAEAHYKYALALEFSSDKADQALPELQKAVAVLKKRIETLEVGDGKGKGKEVADLSTKAQDEIADIKGLIPDMELKVILNSFVDSILGIKSSFFIIVKRLKNSPTDKLLKKKPRHY